MKLNKKSVKAPAKNVIPEYVPKSLLGRIMAVASKGCVAALGSIPQAFAACKSAITTYSFVWPKFKHLASRETLINMQVAGKLMQDIHPSLFAYDLGCYVTGQGGPVKLGTLQAFLESGELKPVFLKTERTGKTLCFVPGSYDVAQKLPQYIATFERKAGRIETKAITGSDNGNSPVKEHVTLWQETAKETKKPAKPASKPASKSKTPVKVK